MVSGGNNIIIDVLKQNEKNDSYNSKRIKVLKVKSRSYRKVMQLRVLTNRQGDGKESYKSPKTKMYLC